ncbi:GNAT family N-acetyltransferase [Acetobacterium woodii]|uniref:Acetyltransferase GNAT family n=1 Tax=Acetobacterium woodii (strain ATCC 29683 / DSM 1030 / JCM 2381 / KCTC 1655 / WB1) TaxID=931626 RepID=H6LKM7_ACEWD|nr:GNAT family N-acetyltransferase [Acetobacterium woodii]AFA48819.1 acetyltransferase GNAT family [Acetobacterium woodii DSM 1030]
MIRIINDTDLKEAIDLVNQVFSEFIAEDYSPEGNKTFNDYLEYKLEEMAEDIISGHKKLWGFYENNNIIGVIGTRDHFHISLMFVHKDHQNKKIATQLFNNVVTDLKNEKYQRPIVLTVNSSPYAVKVYERLGFVATESEQENKGIRFTPMKMTVN